MHMQLICCRMQLKKGEKIMKTIIIENSKYEIRYSSDKPWDYKIYRHADKTDIGNNVKYNVVNDMVFWIIENMEAGIPLKGFSFAD